MSIDETRQDGLTRQIDEFCCFIDTRFNLFEGGDGNNLFSFDTDSFRPRLLIGQSDDIAFDNDINAFIHSCLSYSSCSVQKTATFVKTKESLVLLQSSLLPSGINDLTTNDSHLYFDIFYVLMRYTIRVFS
jgi:hypothetical protein